MDVAFLAYRRSVAELVGHPCDGTDELFLGATRVRSGDRLAQESGGEDRASPGAKVFRGEVLAADVAQVCVHVGRVDRLRLTTLVQKLEELLTGDLEESLDDPRQPPVLEVDPMQLAAFAPKAEMHVRADHFGMSVSQGRQSERTVLLSILLVADPDSGLLEKPDDRRKHLLSRHAGPFQVAVGLLADLRQGRGKGQHPVVLDGIANLAPARVISVLLAPPGVAPGRLQMAARSEEHTSELQSQSNLVCRLLLEKKKKTIA